MSLGGVAWPVLQSQLLPHTDFFLLITLPPPPADPTMFTVVSGRLPMCRS